MALSAPVRGLVRARPWTARTQKRAAHDRIDRGELTRPAEYDLISGLAGLGVYHLVRHGSAASGMTAAVLGYLVALFEPVCRHGESLPGWWSGTGPASMPDPAWPRGHLNLGMAHGIAVIFISRRALVT